jgi:hypothetical protein
LVVIALTYARYRSLAMWRRVAWLAPAAVIAAMWFALSRVGMRGQSLLEEGQIQYEGASEIARGFVLWAQDPWRTSRVDELCAAAFWILVAVVALRGARHKLGVSWIPLACAAVLYLAVPDRVGGGDGLSLRLGVFFPLFVLPTLAPRGTYAFVCATALALIGAGNAAREIRAAQTEVGDFDRVLAAIPPGARLVSLHFQLDSRATHLPSWAHIGAYHRARGGGMSEPSFSVLPHWPLHFRPASAPPVKSRDHWEARPCLYRNTIDGNYYDYVLVRGNVDPFRMRPPGPSWTPIVREQQWTLYEKSSAQSAPDDALLAVVPPDRGPCDHLPNSR